MSHQPSRVLLIGQAFFDSQLDSFRRALAPYYDLLVLDPFSALPGVEDRLGPRLTSQVNQVVNTASWMVLRDPLALTSRRLIRSALDFNPELILVDCPQELRPSTVAQLRRQGAVVVGLFGDAVSNFGRGYFFAADYDRLFFKDHYIVDKLRTKLAFKHVHYLPQACDLRLHRSVEMSEEERAYYRSDISLFGNGYLFRAECLKPLVGRNVKVWGAGPPSWLDHVTAPMFTRKYVAGDEKCKAMLATKIALNPNHYAEIAGTNKRTFEVAAIGAFQLTDAPALAEVFEPDVEVAQYDTQQDLLEKLDYYLERPERRAAMAAKAQIRAHADHTYEHRWVAILETLAMKPPGRFPVQLDELRVRAR